MSVARDSELIKVFPFINVGGVAGEYFLNSIRNSNCDTGYQDMAGYDRCYAIVFISATFNASDTVDTLKLQQATSSSGTGVKDITTSGSGTTYNYDTAAGQVLKGAAGHFAIIEIRAEDLDVANGFHFVRLYAASTGNTGTDNLGGFMMFTRAAHAIKQNQGAAAANAAIYVTTSSSY